MALIPVEQIERVMQIVERFVLFFSKRFLPIVFLVSLSDNVWKEVSQLKVAAQHRLDLRDKDSLLASERAMNRELNREIKKQLQDELDYTRRVISIRSGTSSREGVDSSLIR